VVYGEHTHARALVCACSLTWLHVHTLADQQQTCHWPSCSGCSGWSPPFDGCCWCNTSGADQTHVARITTTVLSADWLFVTHMPLLVVVG
jgi:hypothetical protein